MQGLQPLPAMSLELRPQVVSPTSPHATRLIALSLGLGVATAGALLVAAPPRIEATAPSLVSAPQAEVHEGSVAVVQETVPQPRAVSLVFRAGGASYMHLDGGAGIRHGKAVLHEDDGVYAAVAEVNAKDIAADLRAWRGREVVVDGTCHAHVTDFAVVARLTGDTAYAGEEGDAPWTAKSVLENGEPVLAARLDGCKGEVARDATLPASVTPAVITDPELAARATAALMASDDYLGLQRAWTEWRAGEPTIPTAPQLIDPEVLVVRHPVTGQVYVSVFASTGGGCGAADLTMWGLYRVDAHGLLVRLPAELGELSTIDALLDVDGDGELEVSGRAWISEQLVVRTNGVAIDALTVPFFGCPC